MAERWAKGGIKKYGAGYRRTEIGVMNALTSRQKKLSVKWVVMKRMRVGFQSGTQAATRDSTINDCRYFAIGNPEDCTHDGERLPGNECEGSGIAYRGGAAPSKKTPAGEHRWETKPVWRS